MVTQARVESLARKGFRSPDEAVARLAELAPVPETLVDAVAAVADPDGALASLARIGEAWGRDRLLEALESDEVLRQRLLVVLGTSAALGDFLARHPELVTDLGDGQLLTEPMSEDEHRRQMAGATTADELRVAYHRKLLHVVARDLNGLTTFAQSSAELSDLAVATLGAALEIARTEVTGADSCRLAIVALGKTGGHELNYVSDVDVIFVAEPAEGADQSAALTAGTKLASTVMRLCGDLTAEGTIWEVDAELRPEGNQGPLVRTVASHAAYYDRWATTWEFQALMKARYAAGDAELTQEYLDVVRPLVWRASTRPNFVADTRAMRRRVVEHIPAAHRDRQLKLGAGGLRDVEFAVQLLQLVHGRLDESLRSPTTLTALQALIDGGYVGRRDGAAMEEAYEFLRTLEHRIQLHKLQRTHVVPEDEDDLRRLGRSMGFRQDPVANLTREWQAQRRQVRRLHEKLFYRPLLEAVAALPTDSLRLTTEAARERLEALGFVDPAGALGHIQALTSGVSRRSAIQRSLLPAMLEWFAESPDPDRGLLTFRRVSEQLGESHWYLRKLRDEGTGAEQLARLVSSSSYVGDLIVRGPDTVALLGDDHELVPRSRERLTHEMVLAAARHRGGDAAFKAVRRVRRRELTRIGMADVLGRLDITEVGEALSDLTTATLEAALQAAIASVEDERGELGTRMAVVLMGRLGGHESAYGSDADVMFVHEPLEGADAQQAQSAATAVAQRLRNALGAAGVDPALEVDADLRPEGRNGPLVRSLSAFAAYYDKWSAVWEAQALLRADPVVGDEGLCGRFRALIDPLRWPEGGTSEAEVREIRRIKARVDAERLPRGASPTTHLKLGRGGLADVEWTVQLLQMQHAHEIGGLRTTRTIPALHAAAGAGLLDEADAESLEAAWRMVSRVRNAVVLLRSRPAESMVEQSAERAGVAHLLGYGLDGGEVMVDDYLRTTRQARQVVERVFWGD
ncbi:bifunctional [glutamine synthetase] adenylyltransferase/[glutamine synthetase]-adenylyl-L-tyrosine phosphorylase [Aeromicrobium sp. IC_218]|uniref:bifunctional [glutamine synthetase] adenylyltransferase/[glutamine synthetase]-adenylyl-L-tyrosine phosphorylase n=1 Tax=Aeromicrobium sp. IC_218 TaxID=2545468 RepID=UPI001A955D9E|nr:bifunctional [glutamine synthetase] adenylyltransferase/[glutamine synthetase]-adenylyl-L-tyrosine phosphorylase [Aeromicrobium sp. IC_218]